MKKIILSVLLLLGGLSFFTACEDDTDSNPTLVQPTAFVLNTPAYSGETVDLAHSENVSLSWSQPNYGFPVVANYYLQLSVTGNFTVSVAEAAADESKTKVADYVAAEDSYTLCAHDFSAASVAKMLQQLCKWKEEEVPAEQTVYARIYADVPVSGGAMPSVAPVASNVVQFKVVPYYVELRDAVPEMWYLIGASVGDGKWTNDADAVGTSIVPMNLKRNYAYDKKTGKGEIVFTGYFESEKGFKIIHVPGSWAEQWGQDGEFGKYRQKVGNDEGQDIKVPENGYYTITLDTKNETLNIVPAEAPAKSFEKMYITGAFNGWADPGLEMAAVNTAVAENHVWSYFLDASAGDTELKFMQQGWGTSWGGTSFPYGGGSGDNIKVPQGKYMVVFNDVDGSYTFIAK